MKEEDNSPKFSVLIANYNNAPYLEAALTSVFAQTYSNWEIIIFDDKSTDHSESIYEKYNQNDKIKIFRHVQNMGCGQTKHDAAQVAEGTILGFLDPDDKIAPHALETMVKTHQEHPEASLVYSSFYFCDEALNIVKQAEKFGALPTGKTNLEADKISHFATFKKSAYQQTEGINPNYQRAVDKDLYYKLEEIGNVVYIDEPLYYYRIHEGGISTLKNIKKAKIWSLRAQVAAFNRRGKDARYIQPIRQHYKTYLRRRAKQAVRELNLVVFIQSIWNYFFGNPFKKFYA